MSDDGLPMGGGQSVRPATCDCGSCALDLVGAQRDAARAELAKLRRDMSNVADDNHCLAADLGSARAELAALRARIEALRVDTRYAFAGAFEYVPVETLRAALAEPAEVGK